MDDPVLRSTPGEAPPREVPTSPGSTGMRLGEWDLGAEIGRGAMGIVYRATRARDGAAAAVKVLSPRLAQEERFVERFEREATALSALDHPHIVRVLDRGVSDGLPWFAMELVDGMNLRQRMRTRRLDDTQLMRAMIGVCQALQYAHAQGIVHRDVKPENILVDDRGEARVADFGLARLFGEKWIELSRLSASGGAVGTPFYMSPELLKGTPADGRSDIYSLGVVFYEALTGELPVGRFRSPRELRAEINPRLDDLILKLLDPDPARRPRFAGEVADVLCEVLAVSASKWVDASPARETLETQLFRQTQVRERIRAQRRKSIKIALWSAPIFAGVVMALLGETPVVAAILLGLGVAVLMIANGEAPKYTGAQCPTCHGFQVRKLDARSWFASAVLECEDCHEIFRSPRPVMRSIVEMFRGRRR